jgi:cytochrome c peroxidase
MAPPRAGEPVTFTELEQRRILQHSPLPSLPPSTSRYADDDRAARLGQFLFFDPRLSANGEVSCATCHDPANGFADGKPVAEGMGSGTRHTPALWNVAYNRWHFWDGRADSLWAQALNPIERDIEMGSSRLELAHLVFEDPTLRRAYESIYGALPPLDDRGRFPPKGRPVPERPSDPMHQAWSTMRDDDRAAVDLLFVNAGKAIAAYERRLVSRRAPFDVFVEGLREGDGTRMSAISPSAQRGLKLFVGVGECRLCHRGPNFTDGEFHDIRVAPRDGGLPTDPARFDGVRLLQQDPFNALGPYNDDPEGRAAQRLKFLANGPHNWGAFKTPSLRNVARTAPYMHQGQFETLAQVLEFYSTLKGALPADHHDETILVPRNFSPEQQADIIAFLESLTDEAIDEALLRAPDSPLLD